MKIANIRQYLVSRWKEILLYGGLAVVLGGLLYWRLGSLVPGYAPSELAAYQAGANLSIKSLLENPLGAPFLLAVKALSYIKPDHLIIGRLVATACGALTVFAFGMLLQRWHGRSTALIGTLLFGSSAWFLHTARLGTPEVLLFGVLLLAAAGFWLKQTAHWLPLIVCFLLTASLLYVPGMIWFILLGVLWQWKTIDRTFKKHLATVSIAGVVFVAALVPLGWALFKDRGLIMPWLGLPAQWPTPLAMLENIVKVPFHLFGRNEANPMMWLGTAPVLDVFTIAMFILGGYIYLRHIRLSRTPLFVSILLVTTGLIAVGSNVNFSIIVPFIYLIAAAGVAYLLDQWFTVFPRNPIARSLGWISISLVIAAVCAYHITHYFVGWPKATATHQVFVVKQR